MESVRRRTLHTAVTVEVQHGYLRLEGAHDCRTILGLSKA